MAVAVGVIILIKITRGPYLLGAVHISKRTEAHVVERMVRHLVLAQVRPAVLESPES